MLLHYIELISEYQDTRRSEDVGAPSSDTDTPQQNTPDMPPPPELVQSIKSARRRPARLRRRHPS